MNPPARHFALDEAHRSQHAVFGKNALAATDGHRINNDSEFVDQILFEQILHETRASDHVDVSAVLARFGERARRGSTSAVCSTGRPRLAPLWVRSASARRRPDRSVGRR